ncbi:MAG: hypothetical protein J0L88_13930, partial [Xanthomonadales bacterium]|nr:hypothetical protein [Xanthomonadales bacterium]
VLAEAQGFVGVVVALGLYFFVIIRSLDAARLAKDRVGAYLVLGVLAGIPLARLLADRLHDVGIADPATWATVAVTVVVIALAACGLPAHRAARTDPVEALRRE